MDNHWIGRKIISMKLLNSQFRDLVGDRKIGYLGCHIKWEGNSNSSMANAKILEMGWQLIHAIS